MEDLLDRDKGVTYLNHNIQKLIFVLYFRNIALDEINLGGREV